MTSKQDKEHLLEEVLSESLSDDFREATLQQTLRLARRRRTYRQAYQGASALAAAVLLGFICYGFWHGRSPAEQAQSACEMIQTRPFPASAIISSKPLRSDQLVGLVSTARIIQTQEGDRCHRIINDYELLALVAARPAVLVRIGPAEQKLTFADEADQQGFPLN